MSSFWVPGLLTAGRRHHQPARIFYLLFDSYLHFYQKLRVSAFSGRSCKRCEHCQQKTKLSVIHIGRKPTGVVKKMMLKAKGILRLCSTCTNKILIVTVTRTSVMVQRISNIRSEFSVLLKPRTSTQEVVSIIASSRTISCGKA